MPLQAQFANISVLLQSRALILLALCTLWSTATTAASGESLTLTQAIQSALKNYPSIRVSQEQLNAAAAGMRLARTAYLPRVDALAQFNRATRNNVFGLLLPQNTVPSITGPVIGSNNLGSVWGSAVGALVTWEPFDFGRRRALVSEANAARRESDAGLNRTRFEVAVSAADAYLTLLAAQETIRAAQAGVDRANTFAKIIKAQTDAQLRPGADLSRATAELAAARTQLIQAEQSANLAKATLSEFVGGDPQQISIAPGALLKPFAPQTAQPANVSANPVILEQNATIERSQAQLQTLERSYFPKFALQAAAYARGTGAEVNGSRLGGANGLAPTVQDYALGFTFTFPLLDLPAIRAKEEQQRAAIRSQQAKAEQLVVDLRTEWYRAEANLNAAQQIAANTPIQVSSARAAVEQATARYQAGLGNITEVAEAQRLLTQSEIDDALARLNVWRGLLAIASVAGDIQPFTTEASQ
jgi:outer membrane protein TolC